MNTLNNKRIKAVRRPVPTLSWGYGAAPFFTLIAVDRFIPSINKTTPATTTTMNFVLPLFLILATNFSSHPKTLTITLRLATLNLESFFLTMFLIFVLSRRDQLCTSFFITRCTEEETKSEIVYVPFKLFTGRCCYSHITRCAAGSTIKNDCSTATIRSVYPPPQLRNESTVFYHYLLLKKKTEEDNLSH